MADIKSRVQAIQAELTALQQETIGDRKLQRSLLLTLRKSVTAFEAPEDPIFAMMMGPHQSTCLHVLIRSGVLELLGQENGPRTAAALAEATGSEVTLLVRLMRPMTALGIFKETDRETYALSSVSEALLNNAALLGGFKFTCAAAHPSLANMPYFLEATGMQNVTGSPGPFQDAHKTSKGLFDWLTDDPTLHSNFNDFMAGQRARQQDWHDLFSPQEILLDNAPQMPHDIPPPLLIDIGGGVGHFTAALQKKLPSTPWGPLVLQDLPRAIDDIQDLDPAIVRMKHNFFEEQPVKGARSYFFRSVFHDWAEDDCVAILQRTAQAMSKGVSKLLIFEWVLPEQGTPLYPALLDINMMCILNGMERTRSQWDAMLARAGLKITKVWSVGDHEKSLIEAELCTTDGN